MYNHYSYFYVRERKTLKKTKLGLEDALASEVVGKKNDNFQRQVGWKYTWQDQVSVFND